jgi:hypothetical protein
MRFLIPCIALAAAPLAQAAGVLENPAPAATVSGIGVISGWSCNASRIEVQVDANAPMPAAYGTDRLDTLATCGRRDTGFGLLLNWAVLGAGPHTLRAFADGVEFARASFTVASLGAEFLRGKSGSVTLGDFPAIGQSSVLEWQEPLQSFVLREVRSEAPTLWGRWNGANLEKRSNCTNAQNNGTRGTYAQLDIANDGGVFTIAETAVTGLTCTYNGTYTQDGTRRAASGRYFCSDGKQGDFTSTGILVTPTEMQIRMDIKLTAGESCTIDGILGGSRF